MTFLNFMKEKCGEYRRSERGNALFLILIAVALFAALSYAITQSVSGGGSDSTSEQNTVNAAALTSFPTTVKTGITRMTLGGASLNALDFDRAGGGNGSDDSENDVFGNDGTGTDGGLTFLPPAQPAAVTDGFWFFSGAHAIDGIGGTEAELIMATQLSSLEICNIINENLYGDSDGITNNDDSDFAPPADAATADGADDTSAAAFYPASGSVNDIGEVTNSDLSGQPAACLEDGSDNYYFYYVLQADAGN
mgnify:CR=1 FL=1